MWNPLNTRKKSKDCTSLRDILENAQIEGASEVSSLSGAQQKHLAACSECQQAADDILMARTVLRAMPRHSEVSVPWFAPRVMAAIAAKESELRQSLEAWAAVPRFAARLTWVSALALLLASTWLPNPPWNLCLTRHSLPQPTMCCRRRRRNDGKGRDAQSGSLGRLSIPARCGPWRRVGLSVCASPG